MGTTHFLKYWRSFPIVSLLGICLALSALVTTGSVRADSVTYSFSGTLANAFNGDNMVVGEFTLDTTNAAITAFDFTTPIGEINSTIWTSNVATFTPALVPATDFVQLYFVTTSQSDFMNLVFETPLSTFSGSTFYTGEVTPSPAAILESVIQCNGSEGCSDPNFRSTFVSGAAIPISTPEPSSVLLMVTGLLSLTLLLRRRFGRRLPSDLA